MCLALFAFNAHPHYRLIFAANRDEFYDRPTAQANFWENDPQILAGKDLKQGGTWLGVTREGRFAAVTNYRDPASNREDAQSRGLLVSQYLRSSDAPSDYLAKLQQRNGEYNGFNLIVGDNDDICYGSNRSREIRRLSAGVYGLSNHLLDTPWPKVERTKAALAGLIDAEEQGLVDGLFAVLANRSRPDDSQLPDTGVGIEWERMLSPAFITSPNYGTRSSTVLLLDRKGGATFIERSFGPGGAAGETVRYDFCISMEKTAK